MIAGLYPAGAARLATFITGRNLPILRLMIAPFVLAGLDPHFVGWTLFCLGVGMLVWAAIDYLLGETRINDRLGFPSIIVRQDEEPVRFRRTILLIIFAGVVCLAASAFVLLFQVSSA